MSIHLKKGICELISNQLKIDTNQLSDDELLNILNLEFKKSRFSKNRLDDVIRTIENINTRVSDEVLQTKQKDVIQSALKAFNEGIQSSASTVVHLQSIINCVPEMIFVLDNDFQITEVNKAVYILLNKGYKAILGNNILDFVSEKELLVGLLQDQFFIEEFTFINRFHAEIPTTVHVERLTNERGRHQGYVLVAIDQRINKSRENKLIGEKRKAEELTQAKADFLSVMSHEIRTPLNAVIGLSEILENKSPRADQLELIKTLKFSGENLTSLINDILDYSKIDAGKVILESIPIDLNEIVKNVQKSLLFKAEENRNVIVLNCPKVLPIIYGDRVRIVQILTNLIGNSVKFTKNGEIALSVLEVKRDAGISMISFSVMDTGVGIAPDKLACIFDEFSQEEIGTTRKFGGTGLGLTITRNLVHLHKSEIHVKSNVGVGSNFYFDLEFERCEEGITDEKQIYDFKSLANKKVLLAEDNLVNVMVACNFLDQLNVNYDVAENGEEALKLALENQYSVILMDLQMPVMDGFESAQQMISKNIKTPIIALSASALMDDQVQATEIGMVDFISKPFKSYELSQKLLKYSSL